jgi:hypothetical protein
MNSSSRLSRSNPFSAGESLKTLHRDLQAATERASAATEAFNAVTTREHGTGCNRHSRWVGHVLRQQGLNDNNRSRKEDGGNFTAQSGAPFTRVPRRSTAFI